MTLTDSTTLYHHLICRRFKGSADTTFEDFPNRLAHVLKETHRGLKVLPVIYPTYDTRGALDVAVGNFVEWLTLQALSLESKPLVDEKTGREQPFAETGRGGGRGSVKVALLGHSMGGLVAVDAALKVAAESETSRSGEADPNALWPRIISVMAYDSPYYGVHPNVFRNQASKYISYAQQARDMGAHFAPIGAGLAAVWGMNRNQRQPSQSQPQQQSARGSSKWANALWASGAFATAAAAGGVAAYYNRDQINGAYSYLTEHFEYVSNLWDDEGLKARLNSLVDMPSILFHAYYNYLPTTPSTSRARTFIVLPPLSHHQSTARLFSPLETLTAVDEIDAHISMFSASRNPSGYIEMVQNSAYLLGMAVNSSSLTDADFPPDSPVENAQEVGGGKAELNRARRRRQDDQTETQRRSEAKGPLDREQGLREGDKGLRDEEDDVVKGMRAERKGPTTRSQSRAQSSA